ncbi:MAG: SDR family oxidoreductase [Chloroflexi bacterium]|nr:SDR family oxidoreductase [Chloroflexota bacterium]
MRFSGKVAIVTGGGRGIGQGIATRLAQEGAQVVVADKVQETAASTVGAIKAGGGQAVAIAFDATRREDVRRMTDSVVERFGRIDILVNNVGWFGKGQSFLQTDEEFWDRILDVNLKTTLLCSHAVLAQMVKRNYGKIVSISSGAGKAGNRGQVAYSAAKAGVIGMTKALAWEFARNKINVNCICPGFVDTQLTADFTNNDPRIRQGIEKIIPWGRLAQPADMAAAVCFLASDEAEYVTGQVLSVDGGLIQA